MSKFDRYEVYNTESSDIGPYWHINNSGDWVRYEDVAKLEKEHDGLREKGGDDE